MKSFFFDDTEIRKKPKPKKKGKAHGSGCNACKLHDHCKSPKMEPHGKNKLSIAVVAEAPGGTEDKKGILLVGQAGQFLRKRMKACGLDLDRDCVKLSVVQCRPMEGNSNRAPTPEELLHCRPRLDRQLKKIKPDLIFAFGTPAIGSILRDAPFGVTATNMHGRVVPSPRWGCWVACGFHPSYFVRGDEKHYRRMDDILKAGLAKLAEEPYEDQRLDENQYEMLEDIEDVRLFYKSLGKTDTPVAFDYETNGTDPYVSKFKLLLVSFAISEHNGIVIPLEHPQARWKKGELDEIYDLHVKWLKSDRPKVIQNWAFEELVSRVYFEIEGINNVVSDTMVKAHVLDNRQYITKQAFQEFVRYGSTHKGMVNVARLEKEFLDTVAKYGSLDARYDIKLYYNQEKEMNDDLRRGYDLFHEAIPVFVRMKMRGIKVDQDILAELEDKTEDQLDKFDNVSKTRLVRKYKKKYHREWDAASTQAKQRLFYDMMDLTPLKLTEAGKSKDKPGDCSTDADSLKSLLKQVDEDSEEATIIQSCLDKASIDKLKSSLKGIRKASSRDGVIHASFNLHTASTYRSSSSDPLNFQNFPVRNPKLAVVRLPLVPRHDWLLEMDFKGNEVCGIAAASKDTELILDVQNAVDFHRYFASLLYEIPEDEIDDEQRFNGKSSFVFPEFFGSYYKTIARGRPEWNEDRVKEVERALWKRYKDVKKWQENNQEFYEKNGYVQYMSGFRIWFSRVGLLSFNNVCNSPIQGPSFHRVLRVLLDIEKAMLKRKMESLLIGQIHDSGVFDVTDKELDELIDLGEELAQQPKWAWDAIVPWRVEMKIGKNLLELEKV